MNSSARLTTAIALLVLLIAGVALVLQQDAPRQGAHGEFQVTIVGPEGELFNGTVLDHNATAYSVLVAAAKLGILALDVEENPAYRPCGVYVRGIGGYKEGGTSGGGWEYWVFRNGAWLPRADVGACAFGLVEGDAVEWRFNSENK